MGGSSQKGTAGRLTYEDYVTLPDDGKRYEILDGDLVMTPPPLTRHQIVSANLGFALQAHVRAHKLGAVLFAPTAVVLDRNTIVEPDILFVSRARAAIIERHAVVGAPDLLVEILSRSPPPVTGVRRRSSTRASASSTTGSSTRKRTRSRRSCVWPMHTRRQ